MAHKTAKVQRNWEIWIQFRGGDTVATIARHHRISSGRVNEILCYCSWKLGMSMRVGPEEMDILWRLNVLDGHDYELSRGA